MMPDSKRLAVCRGCKQRAVCRKLWEPGADCEHWPQAEPGLLTLAGRVVKEGARWVRHGLPPAIETVRAERRVICETCAHWDTRGRLARCRHPSCHCTAAKLWLATSACPMRKWLPSN